MHGTPEGIGDLYHTDPDLHTANHIICIITCTHEMTSFLHAYLRL